MTGKPDNLFLHIEDSFPERYGRKTWDHTLWDDLALLYPPQLEEYPNAPRGSFLIAQKTGDTGLALFWVVQATLVNTLRKFLGLPWSTLPGALCHSSGKEGPMVIHRSGESILLDGSKGFITGGKIAHNLIVTGMSSEGSVDDAVVISTEDVGEYMEELELPALCTVPHGKFHLGNVTLPVRNGKPDRGALRRILKTSSIMERSLIVETAVGTGLFLQRRRNIDDEGISLQRELSLTIDRQIESFLQSAHIPAPEVSLHRKIIQWLEKVIGGAPQGNRKNDLAFLLTLAKNIPNGN